MNIKLKHKVIIIGVIVLVIATIAGIFIYVERDRLFSKMGSSNAEFIKDEYKGVVEYSSDINFMFVINNQNKVSNLIFLDEKALDLLADKNIEGSNIETAVYEVIRILNEENLFTQNIILTSYQSNDSLSLIESQVNRNLIVFGSTLQISTQNLSLSDKLNELGLEVKSTDVENVETLYNQSRNKLLESVIDKETSSESISYIAEAMDIYTKLDDYAKGKMEGYQIVVENQQRDDLNGLLITNLKSKSGLVPSAKSWYQIVSSVVSADIAFDETHEFCFRGSIGNYTEGAC